MTASVICEKVSTWLFMSRLASALCEKQIILSQTVVNREESAMFVRINAAMPYGCFTRNLFHLAHPYLCIYKGIPAKWLVIRCQYKTLTWKTPLLKRATWSRDGTELRLCETIDTRSTWIVLTFLCAFAKYICRFRETPVVANVRSATRGHGCI